MKTETYICHACGVDVIRPVVRGQRPKWCGECRRKSVTLRPCKGCGESKPIRSGALYCSSTCRPERPRKTAVPKEPFDPRGELRRGYEDGDADLFFAALVTRADTSGDCWIWPEVRDGYPTAKFGKRRILLHRVVLEVKHGAPLGSQHGHHICANSACVNPDHLQPVTHRENVAEMLARQSYLGRIRELETALAEADPAHPLLAVVAVA